MNFTKQTSATPASIRKKKRIIAMSNKGMKSKEISERIGCSRQYVDQVIKNYANGLPSNLRETG